MLDEKLEFEGLVGVGKVQLDLVPDQHIYTFIGANGVGKTKTLEALFQVLFFSCEFVKDSSILVRGNSLRFKKFQKNTPSTHDTWDNNNDYISYSDKYIRDNAHFRPVIFLGAQARGNIKSGNQFTDQKLGALTERRARYLSEISEKMRSDFGSMNMETSIEEWFVTLARSSNPYQKKEDNREIEIKTVIRLLHEIDNRIDPEFLEISGDDRVSLKIEGQKRELSQLSSGFTSILKLIQAIVSGYGYFTNEVQLQNVKGIVLIDEIESHLHLTWQATIIPLLKKLFPNTTFYITTHSSVVLSQLKEGEAYTLYRDNDGIVKTRVVQSPNKAALADILKDVFQVDLNQMKLENSSVNDQEKAKQHLLALLKQQESKK